MQLDTYKDNQPVWTPAGVDITIRWRETYGWVPASETPEVKAKQDFFRLRQYEKKGSQQ
jgi:hypothetical protein